MILWGTKISPQFHKFGFEITQKASDKSLTLKMVLLGDHRTCKDWGHAQKQTSRSSMDTVGFSSLLCSLACTVSSVAPLCLLLWQCGLIIDPRPGAKWYQALTSKIMSSNKRFLLVSSSPWGLVTVAVLTARSNFKTKQWALAMFPLWRQKHETRRKTSKWRSEVNNSSL